MKLKLSSGEEVKVGVKHENRDRDGKVLTCGGRTVAFVRYGEVEFLGVAVCSREDVFCRKKGRRLASVRLIEALKGFTPDPDRRAILKALCPEFDVIGRKKKEKATT